MKRYIKSSIDTDNLKKEIKDRLIKYVYEDNPGIEIDISRKKNADLSYSSNEYHIYINIENPDYEASYFQLVEDTVNEFLKNKGFELVNPVHMYATNTTMGETYSGVFADRK